MSNVPADLKYTKSHEWLRALPDGAVEIGITAHAQEALGDLVFVEVPEAGRTLAAGEACAVVESVKAASDVYAPLAGTVTGGNPQLAAEPQAVNADPYGTGGRSAATPSWYQNATLEMYRVRWKSTTTFFGFTSSKAATRHSAAAPRSTTSTPLPSATVSITAPVKGWLPMRKFPSAWLKLGH
jgi:glycine cleavage system H protein